uniref:Uncharacterized protein n=1 Tax=Fopius arisanus TaxID=64838 RepID=A0A0C9QPY3_9HYME
MMSRYYLRGKKKQLRRNTSFRQRKRFPTSQLPNESSDAQKYIKNHEHPYATRSKTSRHPSLLVTDKTPRTTPEPNVICLGTYRKIPRFIDLETNREEPQRIALIEKFEPIFQVKSEGRL